MIKFSILMLSLMIECTLAAIPETESDSLVRKITADYKYDLHSIPANRLSEVIIKLREISRETRSSVQVGKASVSPNSAIFHLMRLGDIPTIESMIDLYRRYDSRDSWDYAVRKFERTAHPRIIPYLAVDFASLEDPIKGVTQLPPPGSDDFAIIAPPRSIYSGVICLRIIEKSPNFSPALKGWAKQAQIMRREDPGRFRNLMQAWWLANQDQFAREDYESVVPVAEPLPASRATPMPEPRPQVRASPVPAAGSAKAEEAAVVYLISSNNELTTAPYASDLTLRMINKRYPEYTFRAVGVLISGSARTHFLDKHLINGPIGETLLKPGDIIIRGDREPSREAYWINKLRPSSRNQ